MQNQKDWGGQTNSLRGTEAEGVERIRRKTVEVMNTSVDASGVQSLQRSALCHPWALSVCVLTDFLIRPDILQETFT